MKKLLLISITFLFAFTANVFAQVSDEVSVTADVQAALNISTTNVTFGTIEQAISILAANENDSNSENIGTEAQPGSLLIEGSIGASVRISFDATATLVIDQGDINTAEDIITFTPSFYFGSDQVLNDGSIVLDGSSSTIDIGGELTEPAQTGSFSTDGSAPLNVTVQYVSL